MAVTMALDAIYLGVFAASWVAGGALPGWLGWLVRAWTVLEAAFFCYDKLRRARLDLAWPQNMEADRLEHVLARFLSLADVFPLDEFLSGWFFGAAFERIGLENVLDYIAYGLFHRQRSALGQAEETRARAFLEEVQARWDLKFTPGRDPLVTHMSHVFEPLRVYHKPLVFYCCVEVLVRAAHALLRWQGFSQSVSAGFATWHLAPRAGPGVTAPAAGTGTPGTGATPTAVLSPLSPRRLAAAAQRSRDAAIGATLEAASLATAAVSAQYPHGMQQYHIPSPDMDASFRASNGQPVSDATPPAVGPLRPLPRLKTQSPGSLPIVLLHGVGLGVLPYLHFLRQIIKTFDRHPIMIIEVPHVSLRLCWQAEDVDDIARALAGALDAHGYDRAVVVGHSYGTFVASRFVQLFPKRVHTLAIMDPVCMLVCCPQLLHNFVYKSPSWRNLSSVAGAVDLIRFFCSRDLTISQAFCRKFDWTKLMLWPEELPERSVVALSGLDDLVPSSLVLRQLEVTSHPAKVLHHPRAGHGGILLMNDWQRALLASMRGLIAQDCIVD